MPRLSRKEFASVACLAALLAISNAYAEEHAADRAAIEAVNVEFTRAFNAGDAAGLAALFTDDARMSDETGKTVEGKGAIQKQLANSFRAAPGVQIVLRTDSIKFLSPDVAVEEGASQLVHPGAQQPSDDGDENADQAAETEVAAEFIPYTAIFVKQNGRWLHAVVRDYFVAREIEETVASGEEHLKELEWMVGEWVEEGTDAKTHSVCRWAQNKHFLVWDYTISVEGANAPGGTMYIGWDPLTRQIQSWVFDAQGGHGHATWTRHGEGQWVVKASGVLGDGRSASATQYVTLLNDDLASWTSVDRVAGGDVQPDMSEYVIARQPPRPVSATEPASSR